MPPKEWRALPMEPPNAALSARPAAGKLAFLFMIYDHLHQEETLI